MLHALQWYDGTEGKGQTTHVMLMVTHTTAGGS